MPDLAGTVILLGLLQGAVMSFLLAVRRTDRLANRFLSALVGAVAAMLLLGYVNDRLGFHGYPHLIGLAGPLPFLFGPLLYLYVAALTRPIARFDPRFLAHGLPFAAYVLYMLQVFYLKTGDEKIALANAYFAHGGPLAFRFLCWLRVVQGLAYVLLSYVALRRYGHKIEGYFSDLTRIDLRWLLVMVLAHAAVWSTVLVSQVAHELGMGASVFRGLEAAVQLGSALTVFLTGYISFWQPELFEKALAAQAAEGDEPGGSAPGDPPRDQAASVTAPLAEAASGAPGSEPHPPVEPSARAGAPERPRYQRNRLDEGEAEEFARKLTALMEKERAYRDTALTLPVLAESLGTTPHLLSQVLNVRIGKSFYVFINSYRVDALKAALSDPAQQNRGVLELGLEVGFNSKSTLNSFFKKHTGLTPTEFRRRALARAMRADPLRTAHKSTTISQS
jgi:AraC-like DNA-binding protein